MKMTALWDIAPCSLIEADTHYRGSASVITLIMEAVSTSETLVYGYEITQRNIPKGCHLETLSDSDSE
jgi:hypothetical protein